MCDHYKLHKVQGSAKDTEERLDNIWTSKVLDEGRLR